MEKTTEQQHENMFAFVSKETADENFVQLETMLKPLREFCKDKGIQNLYFFQQRNSKELARQTTRICMEPANIIEHLDIFFESAGRQYGNVLLEALTHWVIDHQLGIRSKEITVASIDDFFKKR